MKDGCCTDAEQLLPVDLPGASGAVSRRIRYVAVHDAR
jgi:hypothetical protein